MNKYYEHRLPLNADAKKLTRIFYEAHKKTSPTTFTTERYNAGFQLERIAFKRVGENSIYLDSAITIWRVDTIQHAIEKNRLSNWKLEAMEGPHYKSEINFGDVVIQIQEKQLDVYDSVIDNKPAKVFVTEALNTRIVADTSITEWNNKAIYLQELGLFGSISASDKNTWQTELIEQMPLSKFERLARHKKKRIAYIDPTKTLDKDSNFQLCMHETLISDYYNAHPDGQYKHGKAALIDSILTNLESDRMMNQTGMLTFRFVVNCEGEAGRFIAEGYDLDYQPYEFPKETIHHLYSLLLKLKTWQPVTVREEAGDAYFYITFKLNNGEIYDILP